MTPVKRMPRVKSATLLARVGLASGMANNPGIANTTIDTHMAVVAMPSGWANVSLV